MNLFLLAIVTILALVWAECPVYLPNSDAMLHMDAEQRGESGGWEFRPSVDAPEGAQSDYLGPGYLVYKPWSSFGGTENRPTNYADPRILTYHFTISVPGVYRVMLRSSAPHPTEHNDLWMSLPESGAIRTKNGADVTELAAPVKPEVMDDEWIDPAVWFKMYQNNGGDVWNTGGFTTDFDPHSVVTPWLEAGDKWYSVRLAGRSTQFKVDRVILFRCEDTECAYSGLRYGVAKAYSGPQNECGGF